MCNCNQQRAGYSAEKAPRSKGMIKVKLTEDNPLVINGEITGRMYVFKSVNDISWVDAGDAVAMRHDKRLQVLH